MRHGMSESEIRSVKFDRNDQERPDMPKQA